MKVIHQPSKDKIEKVKEFLPQFSILCQHYIIPLYFGELPLVKIDSIISNGTATFINTGRKSFGITNHHVYSAYLEMKDNLEHFNCQLGNLTLELESRIIDINENVDLVTFELTSEELKQVNITPLFHTEWPVKYNKTEPEPVFLSGYPGDLREVESINHIIASFGNFMMKIDQMNQNYLMIVLDIENCYTDFGKKAVLNTDLGGFSGAGIFRMNSFVPELLSIVKEYSSEYGIIYTIRSDIIDEYGCIQNRI